MISAGGGRGKGAIKKPGKAAVWMVEHGSVDNCAELRCDGVIRL